LILETTILEGTILYSLLYYLKTIGTLVIWICTSTVHVWAIGTVLSEMLQWFCEQFQPCTRLSSGVDRIQDPQPICTHMAQSKRTGPGSSPHPGPGLDPSRAGTGRVAPARALMGMVSLQTRAKNLITQRAHPLFPSFHI